MPSTSETPDCVRSLPPYEVSLDQDLNPEDNHFPVAWGQIQNLTGRMLTLVEALGLPPGQEKAAKDLARQHIQSWWSDAQENSITSYRGCIGPIQLHRNPNGTERKYVWLGYGDHAVSVA